MENIEQETDITLEHSTEVEKETQDKINHYYHDQQEITARLAALDEEWDIERILHTEAAALTIAGIILGVTVNKKWLALPLAASVASLSAIATWNKPVSLLQKMGFRTRVEIEKEKYALKAIRGDFKYLLDVPNSVWSAVNK
jgi:hypothetical protein